MEAAVAELPRRFEARPDDLRWGRFGYPVTRTQKNALDALLYMLSGCVERSYENPLNPRGFFCSQYPSDGRVVVGLNHQSLTVWRSGRITSNQGQ